MNIRRSVLIAALLLSACSPTDADELDYHREPGFLTWAGIAADVQAPATVQAGQPFTIRVVTFGSTCRRPAPAEVVRVGLRTDVAVYVQEPVGGTCNRALGHLEHDVELVFAERGTALVRIHGQGYGAGAGEAHAPLTIERTITVQ
ncbi:MAG TPA: hypothetical protein VLK84_32025 [Longimicrobium sp.]|nr:hypothetical protein [Longimicrobium sp.]